MINVDLDAIKGYSIPELQIYSSVYYRLRYSRSIEGGRKQPDLKNASIKHELIEKMIDQRIIYLDSVLFKEDSSGELVINQETINVVSIQELQEFSKVLDKIAWSGAIEGGRKQPKLNKARSKHDLIMKAIDQKLIDADKNIFIYEKEEDKEMGPSLHK